MTDVRSVLQVCDPDLLDPVQDSELDCGDAAGTVLFLTDSRRVQKVLWRQLLVLDSMMSLLEGLGSAHQLLEEPRPPQPDGGSRTRWKVLKAQCRTLLEEMEVLLPDLQNRVQQVQERRERLDQLVLMLKNQKRQREQLQDSLLKAQNALRCCDGQLTQLRAESEAVLSRLIGWQRFRNELQQCVAATQGSMQLTLLSFSQSELSVELRPRPPPGGPAPSLEPARLAVSWSPAGRFTLQVDEGTTGMLGNRLTGRRAELGAALLEVLQNYTGQAELLAEIQTLRSSFAIDWVPAALVIIIIIIIIIFYCFYSPPALPSTGFLQL
ncbi:uncharacterized protein si:dkey-225f5.4 isoform X2 [Cololabis saira]|uniref:uncharacterized protein si:dkey-225f5.4 isoform X2 n=1 Tax=Cololabis saira TaxID=129043 RepID=UPI002AD323AD|nr:uncharacterized protein si:dkey-225f5.4 isoform X2 [Cololabis saira]